VAEVRAEISRRIDEEWRAEHEWRREELLTEVAEFDRKCRAKYGPIWDDQEAFAKRYAPRSYSEFGPLRAVQVIVDWYLGPAVAIVLMVLAVAAMWIWILVEI
jgi:hypothetical protein